MSEVIPSITEAEFIKILQQGKLKELKSCEVIGDGYTFTAIIPHGDMFSTGYARTQAEYLGMRSNIVGGVNPDEMVSGPAPVKKWANMNQAERIAYRESKKVAV